MSFAQLDRPNLAAFGSVAALVCGCMVWLGRQVLSRTFVLRRDHAVLSGRLASMETSMGGMATKVDLQHLDVRLRPLETGISVLGERFTSVQEGMQRTEHMVSILLEHQLAKERG